MSDEPSTRVAEPLKRELSWFEQGLTDAVDFWREEARFWRFWAVFATAAATAGWVLAGWALLRG